MGWALLTCHLLGASLAVVAVPPGMPLHFGLSLQVQGSTPGYIEGPDPAHDPQPWHPPPREAPYRPGPLVLHLAEFGTGLVGVALADVPLAALSIVPAVLLYGAGAGAPILLLPGLLAGGVEALLLLVGVPLLSAWLADTTAGLLGGAPGNFRNAFLGGVLAATTCLVVAAVSLLADGAFSEHGGPHSDVILVSSVVAQLLLVPLGTTLGLHWQAGGLPAGERVPERQSGEAPATLEVPPGARLQAHTVSLVALRF